MPNYILYYYSSILPLIGCYVDMRLYLDDFNLLHGHSYIKYDGGFP